jgi:hypothetical protein
MRSIAGYPRASEAMGALVVLSCLLVAGCSGGGATTTSAPTPPVAMNVGQPLGATPSVPAGWKRPLDVSPAPEQGKFKIISQAAAPGDKVRVFFLGAQF